MKKCFLIALLSFSLLSALTACRNGQDESKTIATQKFIGGVTVTLLNGTGRFKQGENDFVLLFKDASGQPVDVGNVVANIYMPPMGAMAPMNSTDRLSTVSTGKYNAKLTVDMKGAWTMTVQFAGKAGDGKSAFMVNAD